jgi:hypothetical protein
VELNPSNRKFTWSNNQVNPVLTKLDRFLLLLNEKVCFH